MATEVNRKVRRQRRHLRVRRKVVGVAERPRLCITKTLRHMHAQLIDDTSGRTLAAASSIEPEVAQGLQGTGNAEAAKAVGVALAKRAVERGITRVVFDRGGCKYHGKVKALADAARAAGLEF
jgi:large subunit ribosomal protein L18